MIAPNLPPMDADRGLLERALANIVENAVKYAPGTDIVVQATAGRSVQVGPDGRPFGEIRGGPWRRGVRWPCCRDVPAFPAVR